MNDADRTTTEQVVLEVWKDYNGQIQVSISQVDGKGSGHGYRLIGPSFIGRSYLLTKKVLKKRDADEIRSYLDKVPTT